MSRRGRSSYTLTVQSHRLVAFDQPVPCAQCGCRVGRTVVELQYAPEVRLLYFCCVRDWQSYYDQWRRDNPTGELVAAALLGAAAIAPNL